MLNEKHNKKQKRNCQKPDQKPSLRLGWSSELKELCLMNEAGEIVNGTEEEPVVLLDDDNCCI